MKYVELRSIKYRKNIYSNYVFNRREIIDNVCFFKIFFLKDDEKNKRIWVKRKYYFKILSIILFV